MNNLNYGVIGNCRTAALISEKGKRINTYNQKAAKAQYLRK